uniref:Aspergillus nuclease S1 n=1 Tax=Zea mays TaxID=4577 RepID=A0A804M978_MAIZE
MLFLFYHKRGDCHNTKGEKNMCVVGAINNYTAALKDSSSPFDPTESLMFLAHFVGDVHQPLHCGHTDDLGGNTIVVHWYRRKTNLHHVWDVNVIETAMKDFYGNDQSTMIQAIQQNITEEWADEEKKWEACRSRTKTCADKYAAESAKLACTAYEGVDQDSTLEDDYFFAALPVVQKRIAQGGVRLAAILNRIFGGNSRSGFRAVD